MMGSLAPLPAAPKTVVGTSSRAVTNAIWKDSFVEFIMARPFTQFYSGGVTRALSHHFNTQAGA